MTRRAFGVVATLTLLFAASGAGAQDSIAVAPRQEVDPARLVAFERTYQVLVHAGDSVATIGTRSVSAISATFAAASAWLVVESRTAISAADSLYLTVEGRPLQWSSTIGSARLAVAFARDSLLGASSTPGGRQNFVHPVPGRALVSIAMLELLLPALSLQPYWSDSLSVVMVDQASSRVVRAELAVIGEGEIAVGEDGAAVQRAAWIMALRAPGPLTVLLWVDKTDARLLQLQQPLPLHVGSLLEYRPVSPR